MNITELARTLRITPKELHENLPELGFDIGAKAIKVNKDIANRIIKEWPQLRRRLEWQRREEEKKRKIEKIVANTEKRIEIPAVITVRQLSDTMNVPINIILAELMKNGIFVSLNEKIDFDTAWLIGSELGVEVIKVDSEKEQDEKNETKLENILAGEDAEKLESRAPVIVVMGHVDHGKTKLLDAVRSTDVVAGEAGGITQHIGAYQVTRRNKAITFIDTPGHEAFTAMRSRGAKIADVAILVVAADDGVKPQTIEAYKIIQAAKIPFVVAINKIDKPEANVEKVKQELTNQLNIMLEGWGGKIICVPISAKDNIGIVDLLDTVLLVADTEAENIKANPNALMAATVIESHVDKGAGPVATLLVQNGMLAVSDDLVLDGINIGKVRVLNNYKGERIKTAGPSMPVQIFGFKQLPKVGDIVQTGVGEKIKFKKTKSLSRESHQSEQGEDDASVQKLNLIIKCDVFGSVEAIEESLEKINTKKIKVKIIHKGLGNVMESDVKRAEATGSIVMSFNVKTSNQIQDLAREKGVVIKNYKIIYDLINDVKEEMKKIIKPVIERVDLGRLKILAVFRTEKNSQIIGGKVLDAPIESNSLVEVIREKEYVTSGKIARLQAGKQDVKSVDPDQECGVQFEGKPLVMEGDILNFYKEKEIYEFE